MCRGVLRHVEEPAEITVVGIKFDLFYFDTVCAAENRGHDAAEQDQAQGYTQHFQIFLADFH